MTNTVDPDQTAPLGAVRSGPTLFAKTCLSENLGSLRYRTAQTETEEDSCFPARGHQAIAKWLKMVQ